MNSPEEPPKKTVDINEMITIVGEYGLFQKIVNFMFCLTMFPVLTPLLIMYFCTDSPTWTCALNSTACTNYNKTYSSHDELRCALSREDWVYTTPRDHSIVTEFDLICDRKILTNLPTSLLFLGFMFGASILGSFADNYGRKITLYVSLTIVLFFGFISSFSGNIYVFLVFRFIVGFFLHGTFPQMYIMISEIVGNGKRAWANNVTFIAGSFALLILALKAYFISSWKMLFRVYTIPYVFCLLFYFFVPESVRFLRVKGKTAEAMLVLRRIAHWNKTEIPANVFIEAAPENTENKKTTPLDLFRTKKIAIISIALGWYSFVGSTTFYSLYLAASDITGHMYIDFVVITASDIPMILIGTYLVNKFGRKKNALIFILISGFACIALGFTPKTGKLKILRLVLGIVGKTCTVMTGMSIPIWRMELFPTHIRGEGVGMTQVLNKIGATSSAWVNTELSKVYDGAAFIFIGVLSVSSFFLLMLLSETQGVNITDTLSETDDETSSIDEPSMKQINTNHWTEDIEANVTSYSNIVVEDTEA